MITGTVHLTPLILAAGASSRMGSPKALLPLLGQTFLDRLIQTFSNWSADVVVVVGYHEAEILAGIRGGARFVRNPRPERGQLSSLQCGLAEIEGAAMFMPVDLPTVLPATVLAVANAFCTGKHPVVAPSFRGKHGHPVCISRPLVEELLALPESAQARDVIRKYRGQTLYQDVPDPGILHDIDTPMEYRQLIGAAR